MTLVCTQKQGLFGIFPLPAPAIHGKTEINTSDIRKTVRLKQLRRAVQRLPFEKILSRELPETAAWTESLAGLNNPNVETKLTEFFPIRVIVARKPKK